MPDKHVIATLARIARRPKVAPFKMSDLDPESLQEIDEGWQDCQIATRSFWLEAQRTNNWATYERGSENALKEYRLVRDEVISRWRAAKTIKKE